MSRDAPLSHPRSHALPNSPARVQFRPPRSRQRTDKTHTFTHHCALRPPTYAVCHALPSCPPAIKTHILVVYTLIVISRPPAHLQRSAQQRASQRSAASASSSLCMRLGHGGTKRFGASPLPTQAAAAARYLRPSYASAPRATVSNRVSSEAIPPAFLPRVRSRLAPRPTPRRILQTSPSGNSPPGS